MQPETVQTKSVGKPFLELSGVCKHYGRGDNRTEVLKDLNLSIKEGEFVAIVGYSGAGKTTLISMIAGLLKPDAGTVMLGGKPITAPGPDRGVVFQNYSLLPWLTVYDNVHLAVAQVFPKWSAAQQRKHTLEAIAKVNLAQAALKKPHELSGGMRQRVSVARALAINPRVLLLDEPLSALDALTRANIQDELVRLWEADKKTVVLITNDVDEGILLADRIIPLSAGPGATLGPSVTVTLPRPRSREGMNHDPEYRRIRTTVIDWLLGPGKRAARRPATPAKLTRPLIPAMPGSQRLTELTIGFVPLTDAAPFIVAKEKDLFRKHGLDVTLKRMTSWAQVTEALSEGSIHAAHLLYGIPIAVTMGMLGSKRKPMVIPWIASRNGQAITLAKKFDGKVAADPAALKPLVDAANAKDESLTFAMTFPHGTHAMWLRYWLAAGGIHPDVDVALTTVPPPNMVAGLHNGYLDGLCVGEPWNAQAVKEQAGFTAIASQDIWRDHPEKVCAFTEEFADANPGTVKCILKALNEASVWLDDPANRPATAHLISPAHYVNCDEPSIAERMGGRYEFGDGRRKDYGDGAMTFSRRNCNYPQLKYVTWWLSQYRRWGMLDSVPDYEKVARRVARFDLYEQAMHEAGHKHLGTDRSPEVLFDGCSFDPAHPEAYARGFKINTMVGASETQKANAK